MLRSMRLTCSCVPECARCVGSAARRSRSVAAANTCSVPATPAAAATSSAGCAGASAASDSTVHEWLAAVLAAFAAHGRRPLTSSCDVGKGSMLRSDELQMLTCDTVLLASQRQAQKMVHRSPLPGAGAHTWACTSAASWLRTTRSERWMRSRVCHYFGGKDGVYIGGMPAQAAPPSDAA